MARANASDPLHKFRFHLKAEPLEGGSTDPLQPETGTGLTNAEAGFKSGTTPEYEVESVEYREGFRRTRRCTRGSRRRTS